MVVGRGGAAGRATRSTLGARIAAGVCLARDLVNTPGGDLTPPKLAEAAVEVAEREDLEVSVLDEKAIAKAGLGGLLGVNRGSTQPARFIELTYAPAVARAARWRWSARASRSTRAACRSRRPQGMTTMKDDMGGAAAILGAMSVLRARRAQGRGAGPTSRPPTT